MIKDVRLRFHIFALLVVCSLALTAAAGAQEKVFVIRHAEQELSSGLEPVLTEAGRDRAAGLARMLRDTGIGVVFSSSTLRTQETGAIIAAALGVPTRVFPKYGYEDMLARLAVEHADETVLVVANSGTIPAILKLLGAPDRMVVDKSDYDNVFLAIMGQGYRPSVIRLRMP